MKFFCFFTVFILGSAFAFTQTREESRIYIRSVAENTAHADFFLENFAMEAIVGGYNLTTSPDDADFILGLTVIPNTIRFDDGTEEPVPPDEKQFLLRLSLARTGDNIEIIAFSFPFTELEEMYIHNPYLLRDIMVNIPFSRPTPVAAPPVEVEVIREVTVEVIREVQVVREIIFDEPDLWRNKWLYLRMSADLPITYYEDNSQFEVMPGATLGLEVQFLNWMSAELNFQARFINTTNYTFTPGIGLQLKFPLKPARHFMLSPYIAGSYSINVDDLFDSIPGIAVGGGFQFGVKGGERGAWFFDVNFMHMLDEAHIRNVFSGSSPSQEWNRFTIGIGIGYKIGFIARNG